MTPLRVLLTFSQPWEEIPSLASLCAQGVDYVQIPLTLNRTVPCPGLLEAVRRPGETWVCVLSRMGATGLHQALQSLPEAERPHLACVGVGTAQHLKELGWNPKITGKGGAEALLRILLERGIKGPVILAKGNRPSPGLEVARAQGLNLEAFQVYENMEPPEAPEQMGRELKSCQAICLASPSAVERLALVWKGARSPHLLSIGSSTTRAITQRGWTVFQECEPPLFSEFAMGVSRLLTLQAKSS